jgi:D-glycero-alpha-D-manno-heptose-7-phosphate kinase
VVIARTPLRISFVGGGSDLNSFAREHGGAVVSTAIDKYVYVVVTQRFEEDIRVSYSKTEIVGRVDEVSHDLVRESLRMAGLPRRVEIVTIADVPARGTGLGSSSAVTVGSLNALFTYQGILKTGIELAEGASEIEIDVLGKPIGKQDQYCCALGGLNLLVFGPGNAVRREPVVMTPEARTQLERSLLMFYTGSQRSAESVLTGLDAAAKNQTRTQKQLEELRDLAFELYAELGKGNPDVLGEFLHRGWEVKRQIEGVSTPEIDAWYERARSAGALGGKLLGAGGGGFLLFYAPREKQAAVRRALDDLRELPIAFDDFGSRIIFIGQ